MSWYYIFVFFVTFGLGICLYYSFRIREGQEGQDGTNAETTSPTETPSPTEGQTNTESESPKESESPTPTVGHHALGEIVHLVFEDDDGSTNTDAKVDAIHLDGNVDLTALDGTDQKFLNKTLI